MFVCESCGYKTHKKCNFDRHNVSVRHKYNAIMLLADVSTNSDSVSIEQKEHKPQSICKFCHKEYNHRSSLARHIKTAHKDRKKDGPTEINLLKTEMEKMRKELEEIKNNKQNQSISTIQKITNYNFIQSTFTTAEPLQTIDCGTLKHETDKELLRCLEYHYDNDSLHIYIGDYIVEKYKKEDPNMQSLWNVDKARHNYSVRSKLEDKSHIWLDDAEAKKVKEIVVRPLLLSLRDTLSKEIQRLAIVIEDEEDDHKLIEKYEKKQGKYAKIQSALEFNAIASNIIKHISPNFYLDQGQIVKRLKM